MHAYTSNIFHQNSRWTCTHLESEQCKHVHSLRRPQPHPLDSLVAIFGSRNQSETLFLVKSSLGFNVYGGQTEQSWFPGESNSFFSVISRLPNLQPCKYSNCVYGKKTPAQSIINNLQFRWIIDEWSISGFHFSFPVCKYILLHTCTSSLYIYITQLTCTTIKCVSTCSFMIVCCIPVFLFSNPLPAS